MSLRIVHMSDLHLGFSRYARLTPAGLNQREADCAQSFDHAIAQTIALAPELVVIGGDVFHDVRPGNRSIVHAYRGFDRLRKALPHTEVVMAAGNHDTPRASDSGGILRLFSSLGIHVVDSEPRVIDLPQLDVAVLAVPDSRVGVQCELAPKSTRRHNVLLLHGETGGISHGGRVSSLASARGLGISKGELTPEELHVSEWDYIALGHYHVYRQVAPNGWYSGAIDYTSSNTWGELEEERARGISGKGIAERDLVTGAQTFHPLPRSREFVDLPPLDAHLLSPAEIDAAIGDAVESIDGGIDGKVVRMIVTGAERSTLAMLDRKAIRQFRARALVFDLDVRKPEVIEVGESEARSTIRAHFRSRAPLEVVLADFLTKRELPADLNRADFLALGAKVLGDATKLEAKRSVILPEDKAAGVARAQLELAKGTPSPYDDDGSDDLMEQLTASLPGFAA